MVHSATTIATCSPSEPCRAAVAKVVFPASVVVVVVVGGGGGGVGVVVVVALVVATLAFVGIVGLCPALPFLLPL